MPLFCSIWQLIYRTKTSLCLCHVLSSIPSFSHSTDPIYVSIFPNCRRAWHACLVQCSVVSSSSNACPFIWTWYSLSEQMIKCEGYLTNEHSNTGYPLPWQVVRQELICLWQDSPSLDYIWLMWVKYRCFSDSFLFSYKARIILMLNNS